MLSKVCAKRKASAKVKEKGKNKDARKVFSAKKIVPSRKTMSHDLSKFTVIDNEMRQLMRQ